MKRALICGISGQDGTYLSGLLIDKGYEVYGTSRDAEILNRLGYTRTKYANIKIISASLNDFRSIFQVISRIQPDEIYNLSGQSSVGLSFEQPVETFNSITVGTLNLLEAIRIVNPHIKFYNAASSECFGDTKGEPANELTKFAPRSPYAVAKAATFWYVSNYREAYNLFACSGILFNHESPLRPERFVTQKIISSVIRIANGEEKKLELGNVNIYRDWGWAPEYVEAMYLMLQQNKAEDFVIATGVSHSLFDFITYAFSYFNLDSKNFLIIKDEFKRPLDIDISVGNSSKAKKILGWEPKISLEEIVIRMIEAKLKVIH